MQRRAACRIGKEQACDENAGRTAAYWEVERQAGETREEWITHDATWRLEHQEIAADGATGSLLVLERFRELERHFLD